MVYVHHHENSGCDEISYLQEPVAIVGMACRYPGAAGTSQLWNILEKGHSAQRRVPGDRFNIDAFYHPELKRPGSMPVDGGYFIEEDFKSFDAPFFGIRASEATAMDPQHRKMLEVVYECMESAGLTLETAAGSLTGVYMANFAKDFNDLLIRDSENPVDYKFVGTTSTLLSNRVSHVFDLKGPSSTVDTACSGSMYALHSACTALQAGECRSAFVGGASLIMGPDFMIDISKSGVLSNTSTCHTFDESADGYARADGIGALYLKLLVDAVRDGDPVRAVVRSTAVNANGKTAGITHPSREGQRAVIQAAYRRAGILDTLGTSYVECHGTGTPVGDPLEVSAIADVFCGERTEHRPLLVGSVKTNIGHAEPAAAIAGIMKVVLALEHDQIPATIGIKNLTSKSHPALPRSPELSLIHGLVDWKGWNIKVVTEAMPWPKDQIRRASVNSFGYGGANSHVIVEEFSAGLVDYAYRIRAARVPLGLISPSINSKPNKSLLNGILKDDGHALSLKGGAKRQYHLLCFSGHDEQTLMNNTSAISQVAEKYDFGQLAHNLAVRRTHLSYRAFTVVQAGEPTAAISDATLSKKKCPPTSPSLGFVFTGQGAQWSQMGKSLLYEFPCFKEAISGLDHVLSKLADRPSWTLEEAFNSPAELLDVNDPLVAQPLCTALQIALVVLFRSWGINPAVTIGHSSGEIGAAFASGRLSAAEAIVVAYYRGLAARKAPPGAMLAVGIGQKDLTTIIKDLPSRGLAIACHNSPQSVTLSGESGAVADVEQELVAAGHFARQLRTGRAYHSHHMEAVGEWYTNTVTKALQGLAAHNTPIAEVKGMVSTVSGKMLCSEEKIDASYWRRNMESPVLFSQGFETLLAHHPSLVLLEIGPHSALAGPIRDIKKAVGSSGDTEYIPTLIRNQRSVANILQAAGQLFLKNYSIDFRKLCPSPSLGTPISRKFHTDVLVDLPRFQWNHSREYWSEPRYTREWRFRAYPRHDILGSRVPGLTEFPGIWRNTLTCKDLHWLEDHKIGASVVFPAAGYLCMAVEAVFQVVDQRNKATIVSSLVAGGMKSIHDKFCDIGSYEIADFSVKSALSLPENTGVETFFDLRPIAWTNNATSDTCFEFRVSSVVGSRDVWSEHAVGKIRVQPREYVVSPKPLDTGHGQWASIEAAPWYDAFGRVGLNYGPTFRGLSKIEVGGTKECALARAQTALHPAASVVQAESLYAVHPATLDTCLHLAFMSLQKEGNPSLDKGYLPVFAERIVIAAREQAFLGETNDHATVVSQGRLTGLRSLSISSQICSPNGRQVLDISEFRCLAIEAGPSITDAVAEYPISRLEWKPDIDLLEQRQAETLYPSSSLADENSSQHFSDLETLTFLCMVEALSKYPQAFSREVELPHIKKFKEFVTSSINGSKSIGINNGMDEPEDYLKMPSVERCALMAHIEEKLRQNGIVDGLLIRRIFDHLGDILTGNSLSIDILLEDDLWSKFYIDGLIVRAANEQIYRLMDLLSHKKPNMKILEVGAGTGGVTTFALEGLRASGAFQRYMKYTFTDVSAGFFPAAQEKFRSTPNMEYRTLDIERSPEDQGFTAGEYDLVIAANVLHATPSLLETLKNVRYLLKPGGKLALVEGTRETLVTGWIFGTFPGWWQEDGRVRSGGFASRERWQFCLRNSGYTGIDLVLNDYKPPISTISTMLSTVSTPDLISDVPDEKLFIITGKSQSDSRIAHAIVEIATMNGMSVQHSTLPDATVLPGSRVCFLADLEKPLLLGIDESEFESLKRLVSVCKEMFWITTGASLVAETPERAMSLGFTRAVRAENPNLKLRTLDFADTQDASRVAEVILRHFQVSSDGNPEDEWAVDSNGISHVERLVPDEMTRANDDVQEMCTRAFHDSAALRIDIETVGLFDAIYFKDDEDISAALSPDYVEVKVAAVGMNMKDVLNVMGQVDQHYFSLEAAGVISRVGSEVTHLKPGDRVMCLGQGHYGTYKRTHNLLCQRIRENEDFSEMATMPVVYSTVWYCLRNIANLQPGESILIHAAAGGVGIAAIELAQYLKAEIFATVGSKEKRNYLRERYGIADDHIFSSRDSSFKSGIMNVTNGRGVDVTLNSTINELLHETFSCLAVLGRHVDIVNRDIQDRGKLGMQGFDGSRSFTFFYLGDLMEYRPKEVYKVMASFLDLYRQGKIGSVKPLRTFDVAEIGTAMRYFSEGKHIGKIVISYNNPTAVVKYKPTKRRLQLNPDASYLLIGGLGGLGQSLAVRMLERGARHFVFMSPSGMDKPESKETVTRLESAGATVDVLKGTATSLDDVRAAIHLAKWPIRGVVHAAMILKDNFVPNMTTEDFNAVCAPKVLGAMNLHRALSKQELDFFVLTSSISGGISGWQGQSNYGAANAFLDSFARYRNSLGLPAVSVNLGVILGVGIVSKNKGLHEYLARGGFYGLQEREFLSAMELAMHADQQHAGQLVVGFDPHRMKQNAEKQGGMLSWSEIPRLSIVAAAMSSSGTLHNEASHVQKSLGERVKAKRQAEGDAGALEHLGQALTARFAEILNLTPEEIDLNKPLSTYGMDSMLAAELRTWLFKQAGADVSLLEILQPTFSIAGMREKVWGALAINA